MYDVYLNGKNDLLVVRRGQSVASDLRGNWKKKRAVESVSEMIRPRDDWHFGSVEKG
jgi:hypothetical protein